jgi:hypothetical protein
MFTQGTLVHSLYRGALVFVAFGMTTLMAGNPEWGTVTLGALASAFVHYLASQLEVK